MSDAMEIVLRRADELEKLATIASILEGIEVVARTVRWLTPDGKETDVDDVISFLCDGKWRESPELAGLVYRVYHEFCLEAGEYTAGNVEAEVMKFYRLLKEERRRVGV